MAFTTHLILFSLATLFLSLSHATLVTNPPRKALHLSIRKDAKTLQYYITLRMGSNRNYINTTIDLSGRLLWFKCDGYKSKSYRVVRCESTQCKVAMSTSCSTTSCDANGFNPFAGMVDSNPLGLDTIRSSSNDGNFSSPNFILLCSGKSLSLEGLAKGIKGIVGLGRNTNISLPAQLSSSFKLPRKFAICLPSSTRNGLGDISIGGGPYYMPPASQDFSKSLISTPLILNRTEFYPSYDYLIGVTSIKVDDKIVPIDASLLSFDKRGVGGTKLSTVTPYTILHTSIYKALANAFAKAASLRKIKSVASVAPFRTCFGSSSYGSFPNMDLVLQNESVKWRFYGANSMVLVKKNVMCLAFIDGGSRLSTSIELGGHQLENYVMEFDLVSSKLGFSSSLLVHKTSCSHYRWLY